MSYFAVIREAGSAWKPGGVFDQPGADEHATFMNALADEGFVLFAGPLAGSERGMVKALVVVKAADEAEIHSRLADDPWVSTGQLVTVRVESWEILVGRQRLVSAPPAG